MGFSEDDRVRSKNKQYNFPTTAINQQARNLIDNFKKEGFSSEQSLSYIENELVQNRHGIPRNILKTAKVLLEKYL